MAIKKIGLCSIIVSDVKKSTKFFTDIIGLKIQKSAPEYGWFELSTKENGALLGIGQSSDPAERPGTNALISFYVDNLEDTKKELESKGVKFITEIIEIPNMVKMAVFIDPDGNRFFLTQDLKK